MNVHGNNFLVGYDETARQSTTVPMCIHDVVDKSHFSYEYGQQ